MPRLVSVFVALVLPVALCGEMGYAQQTPPEPAPKAPSKGNQTVVEKKALKAFHGPDLKGKDGPMAKAGLDLALLYFRYQEISARGGDFDPGAGYQVTKDNHVVVDAIAQPGSTTVLRKGLARIGARGIATAGQVVSGLLPIDQIPEASGLSSLQGLRPTIAKTQSGEPQLSSGQRAPQEGSGTSGILGGMLVLLGVLFLVEMT